MGMVLKNDRRPDIVTLSARGKRVEFIPDGEFYEKMRFWCLYLSGKGIRSRREAENLFGCMLCDVLGADGELFLPCKNGEDFHRLCRAVRALLGCLDRWIAKETAEILAETGCFDR